MFKAKIKANIIKEYINIVGLLSKEFKLKTTKEGIETQVADPSHVAMICLNLKKDAFMEYNSTDNEYGIYLDRLNPILKLATDDVEMEYLEKEKKMIIRLGNLERSMGLIDSRELPDLKIPDLKLPAKITMNPDELKKGVKAASDVTDDLRITITKDSFQLVAKGDTDDVELIIPAELLINLKTDKQHSSRFSINHFEPLIKNVKNDLSLNIADDCPIKIEYTIADGKGNCMMLVAPRIEQD